MNEHDWFPPFIYDHYSPRTSCRGVRRRDSKRKGCVGGYKQQEQLTKCDSRKIKKGLGVLMPAACSAEETCAFLRTTLAHRYVMKRVRGKHSNSNSKQSAGLCPLQCACTAALSEVRVGGHTAEGK